MKFPYLKYLIYSILETVILPVIFISIVSFVSFLNKGSSFCSNFHGNGSNCGLFDSIQNGIGGIILLNLFTFFLPALALIIFLYIVHTFIYLIRNNINKKFNILYFFSTIVYILIYLFMKDRDLILPLAETYVVILITAISINVYQKSKKVSNPSILRIISFILFPISILGIIGITIQLSGL
jgi:hypothetical protein